MHFRSMFDLGRSVLVVLGGVPMVEFASGGCMGQRPRSRKCNTYVKYCVFQCVSKVYATGSNSVKAMGKYAFLERFVFI